MESNQILINPNQEVFSKMGVKNLEIKNILLNTRYRKIIFSCSVNSYSCIEEIDLISKNVLEKFGNELEVDFLTEAKEFTLGDEDLKNVVDRAIVRLKLRNSTSRSFLSFYKLAISND